MVRDGLGGLPALELGQWGSLRRGRTTVRSGFRGVRPCEAAVWSVCKRKSIKKYAFNYYFLTENPNFIPPHKHCSAHHLPVFPLIPCPES